MKKTIVIVANYADTEGSYGLLGPQMAATVIRNNTDYDCLVVGVGHDIDKEVIKKSVIRLTGKDRPVIGFSNLGGRPDLYELAGELKAEGATTILGGPQSGVDFTGEVDWERYPHRFSGVSGSFSFALQGPVEQLVPFLNTKEQEEYGKIPGLLFFRDGRCQLNQPDNWNKDFLSSVNWHNLYKVGSSGIEPVEITNAQVVQQLGCPHAARAVSIDIDYPAKLGGASFTRNGKVSLNLRGCSFCDVARDKTFGLTLPIDNVVAQVSNLPEDNEGIKIPFELINEVPLPTLPQLLAAIEQKGIRISQVNLVTRVDWLIMGEEKLRVALSLAKAMNVRILLSAVGFESFVDSILVNLNKGYTVDTSLSAIKLMRQLKEEFPENWFYATEDGANHGLIHPTPWDSLETEREMNTVINLYGLNRDILPRASVPLIIHHACGLGDWARELELREGITLKRRGSIIEWW